MLKPYLGICKDNLSYQKQTVTVNIVVLDFSS
jgi:hypothetical protein